MSTPNKKYNLLSEQGIMKMLTSNDFSRSLIHVSPESIWFSAVPKHDVDFAAGLVKQQTDEIPENLCSVCEQLSELAHVEDFLQIYFSKFQKRKLNSWQEDETITNCGKNTGKELLQSQKLILF